MFANFIIYLRILKIIVNYLQSVQLSVYFVKIKYELYKIFENNICKYKKIIFKILRK